MVTGIKKKILDLALRHTISSEIKRLIKDGANPTVEIVLKNADQRAIAMLLGQGYTTEELIKITEDEIRKMVEDTIKELKCKG